jgi:threonine aldolase
MIVDLRSDTVTKPTPEMLEAMMNAELGDDVLGDDPTVHALEAAAAEKMGKEAAMFVPSGTMGNQSALKAWLSPGDAIIVEQDAHIMYYESGAPGAISGVVSWTLKSNRGVMDPQDILDRVTPGSIHTPTTKLLCLENTHNKAGGTVIPLDMMKRYREIANHNGMNIHLDGARIFNAAVYLGLEAKEIAQYSDSVSFCLSKGLSCPVGSVLCGPKEFIEKARYVRKRLGGGMRQAGILAACGLVALKTTVDRLAEDHRRARAFAERIASCPGLEIDLEAVQTNIVRVNTATPAKEWADALKAKNVWCFPTSPSQLRFVFHREIDDEKLDTAIAAICDLSS